MTLEVLRMLAMIRLTRMTDRTSSPERQKADLEGLRTLKGRPVVLVDTVTDTNVSALEVPPMLRPKLAPWLTEPDYLEQYDVLVAWKFDRFLRNRAHYHKMQAWAYEHNKKLYFLKDDLFTDPDASMEDALVTDLQSSIKTTRAEGEARDVKLRILDQKAWAAKNKYWNGGSLGFGYEPYTVRDEEDKKRKKLRKSVEHTYPLLREIIDATKTRTLQSIADEFTERRIPTPRQWLSILTAKEEEDRERIRENPKPWLPNSIREMFVTDRLLGYRIKREGRILITVRDEVTGAPVQQWEPLMTPEELERVRTSISKRGRKGSNTKRNVNPLRAIVFCLECERNLHLNVSYSVDRKYRTEYLVCRRGTLRKDCKSTSMIRLDTAKSLLEDSILDNLGANEITEREWVSGHDHTNEIKELKERVERVNQNLILTESEFVRKAQMGELDKMMTRLQALEAQPVVRGHWKNIPTGETYAMKWARLDWDGRADMLEKAGIKLYIRKMPNSGRLSESMESRLELP